MPRKPTQRIYLQCRQSYSVYLAETVVLPRKQNPAHSVSLLCRTMRLLLVPKQSIASPDCHVIQSQPIQTKIALLLFYRSITSKILYPCIVCLTFYKYTLFYCFNAVCTYCIRHTYLQYKIQPRSEGPLSSSLEREPWERARFEVVYNRQQQRQRPPDISLKIRNYVR